ncbi:MAG: hydroxyacylglutathione hydrolase [Gammaproteobacteria bacterium]|nr:hydroxyacylglutathione hydrolase [Gammaproteobacteria bacterium]|tara:strand:- start:1796 stop:2527 length:732 start_codon:yes stop_codon:yes gene_type:complete
MRIFHIPAFLDNYIWAIQKENYISVIDPGDPEAVKRIIDNKNLKLKDILITHHHFDHTGGIAALKKIMEGQVYGPDNPSIKGIDTSLIEGQKINTLGIDFSVIETPGHTLDHISYFSEQEDILFCGDTLFSGGCGRLFEGTYTQMHKSLSKLSKLPNTTLVYCTHEYTLSNLKFALTQIDDLDIKEEVKSLNEILANGGISLPSTILKEKKINLFLGFKIPDDLRPLNAEDRFKELRIRKDNF